MSTTDLSTMYQHVVLHGHNALHIFYYQIMVCEVWSSQHDQKFLTVGMLILLTLELPSPLWEKTCSMF